jgi:uncharacterized protein (TIGR01777 family)
MPIYEHRSRIPLTAEALFAWHARPGALTRLVPPWLRLEILERSGTIRDGDRLVLAVRRGPLRIRWEALHEEYVEGQRFTDRQLRGPFTRWRHVHEFRAITQGESELCDRIEFALPLGPAGTLLERILRRRVLEPMFAWRHERTLRDLRRLALFVDRPRLRVAIAGSSGLVGRQLSTFLTTGGHSVTPMLREPRAAASGGIFWRPERGEIDAAGLEGFDAVVHLGGENIAARPWTPKQKERLRSSRVASTRLLAETLAGLDRPPATFLCASASGYYGDRGYEIVTEDSPPGVGFLPELCQQWEAACEPARAAGIRVLCARFGVVLTPLGGALAKMLPPFRLGLGGRIGRGEQFMSWIALDDAVGALHHVLLTENLSGPVNLVAPNPVSNREFTATLGKVLRRPALAPVPAFAIRLLFGEMGERLLLEGQRVLPARLVAAGFSFEFPVLEDALCWELGIMHGRGAVASL